jgi:hypothetical protein
MAARVNATASAIRRSQGAIRREIMSVARAVTGDDRRRCLCPVGTRARGSIRETGNDGALVHFGLVVLAAGIYLRWRPSLLSFDPAVAQPLVAHAADAQPVYSVVGYTPDGRPATTERAIGYQPVSFKTNTLANNHMSAAVSATQHTAPSTPTPTERECSTRRTWPASRCG